MLTTNIRRGRDKLALNPENILITDVALTQYVTVKGTAGGDITVTRGELPQAVFRLR